MYPIRRVALAKSYGATRYTLGRAPTFRLVFHTECHEATWLGSSKPLCRNGFRRHSVAVHIDHPLVLVNSQNSYQFFSRAFLGCRARCFWQETSERITVELCGDPRPPLRKVRVVERDARTGGG